MASPISIGDAYMMGKLALKLGRALTKGRKSAPTEFRELENQLYSLSATLSALDSAIKLHDPSITIDPSSLPTLSRQQPTGSQEVIGFMLKSCGETLEHLRGLLTKYDSIREPMDPKSALPKRLSREIKENWKKVKWTTEGGDIAMLKSQLMIHTNSLNLLLGVINHSQGNRLEDRATQLTSMLTEIHAWFVENLKDTPAGSRRAQDNTVSLGNGSRPLMGLQFQLYEKRSSGEELICGCASLHPTWDERIETLGTAHPAHSSTLFQCNCAAEVATHAAGVAAFGLSHLSFAVRVAGKQRAWMIYKTANQSTNKMVSLLIKNMPAPLVTEFETNFIENLRLRTARSMIQSNTGTILAYNSFTEVAGNLRAHILDCIGDNDSIRNQIESVTFTISRQSFVKTSIKDIQILHYNTLKTQDLLRNAEFLSNDIFPQKSAEVLIFFDKSDGDLTKDGTQMVRVNLDRVTKIHHSPDKAQVVLQNVDCSGIGPDGQEDQSQIMNVTFELVDSVAALQLGTMLENMKMELFALALKTPQSREEVLLKLEAKGVRTEDINIADSDISILRNTETGRHRLLVVSRDGCTILSQALARDFMSGLNGKPNFSSPTYVLQIEGMGVQRLHKYENGFRYFDFSDVQMDRLFELGLVAVSNGPTFSEGSARELTT